MEQHTNATIMMVDDEPLTMEMVQIFLEDAGYSNFVLVEKSPLAMETIARKQPDVVLLDLNMPEVSGFEILSAIRAKEALKYLPVIVLTSSTDAETKLQALELGATDFLSKPVDASELALRVRNMLAVKAYQDQLAYYDPLTGLPNLSLITDRTTLALNKAERDNSIVAVLLITLSRFKEVKETLGQNASDTILKEIAQRIETCLRASDSIGRIDIDQIQRYISRVNGDEFMLLLPGIRKTEDAAIVAKRITERLSLPIAAGKHEVVVQANVGIAAYPADGEKTTVLMRNAASAASLAAQTQDMHYQFYSQEFNACSMKRLNLESLLRKALENNELSLHYQPKVAVDTGRVYGVEASLRWQNSELGNVSPVEFVPIAEDAGLISAIGEWVLKEACRQQQKWQHAGLGELNVAVNLSVKQFHESRLIKTVQTVIESTGINPQSLTLEVTESALIGDIEQSVLILKQLQEMGPKLSIDDFGTGYSSLSYLKQFPLNELKIDRSFIMDLQSDARDAAIVNAIIFLAQSLGMSVVAEGVELQEQLDFLHKKRCDVYQGYLYSRPLPVAELEQMLLKKRDADTSC
ncbi:MAG: GGDEF/EAL domain-containing response regulator [Pseudomonadales bacterium]